MRSPRLVQDEYGCIRSRAIDPEQSTVCLRHPDKLPSVPLNNHFLVYTWMIVLQAFFLFFVDGIERKDIVAFDIFGSRSKEWICGQIHVVGL